ncbi:nucleoside hydrolase-like [Glandiceps talaboti]
MSIKLVIDCDAGIDDAQAIMMAVSRPNVEILAITCVKGNVAVRQVCRNVLKVLDACDQLQKIPVYQGAESPLISRDDLKPTDFHGKDGLGNVPFIETPDDRYVSDGHAVNKLIELVKLHPGELTIVALGPLTNLALAQRLYPDFSKRVKMISVMGGNIEGVGNIAISAEFNFFMDVEAAHIILNDFQCPLYISSWELCLKSCVEYARCEMSGYDGLWILCDPIAMAVALDSTVIKRKKVAYATVEMQGSVTRGMMVIDWNNALQKRQRVNLVFETDVALLKKMMEDAWKAGVLTKEDIPEELDAEDSQNAYFFMNPVRVTTNGNKDPVLVEEEVDLRESGVDNNLAAAVSTDDVKIEDNSTTAL